MIARRVSAALGGVAAVGAACVAYGTFVEAQAFRVRRVEVPVLAGGEPLRILHLSDLHLLPWQHRKMRFVDALADLEPHLVVNTGDNLAHPDVMPALLATYRHLFTIPGGFVFGSNDFHGPVLKVPTVYFHGPSNRGALTRKRELLDDARLRSELVAGGWADLMGHRATFDVAGHRVELRGTDDAHLRRYNYADVAGPRAEGADVAIGVTHAPYRAVLEPMVRDGMDLILAGHTHGGQVCVPGYGALVTNCDLPTKQAKGLSTVEADGRSSWLHVSAGLGTSPYAPFRFACPPEATLLTLVAR